MRGPNNGRHCASRRVSCHSVFVVASSFVASLTIVGDFQTIIDITFTYPVVLVDRWGATDDLATSSLHSSRLSVFLMAAPSVMPVHSGMLSSHLFFCLPRLRPPCTVPSRIVLASPEDLVMCPYHFSLRRFTVVKRSSWDPMACRVLFRTSSFEMWSL